MAQRVFQRTDGVTVEAHAFDDKMRGISGHVPKVQPRTFPFVKLLPDGTWEPVAETEADGRIIGEIGCEPARPAQKRGMNPATQKREPDVPATPASRAKVQIQILPAKLQAVLGQLLPKE